MTHPSSGFFRIACEIQKHEQQHDLLVQIKSEQNQRKSNKASASDLIKDTPVQNNEFASLGHHDLRNFPRDHPQIQRLLSRVISPTAQPGLGFQKITDWMAGWWLGHPSEKNESQLGWLFPIYGKIKNVPNHQPVNLGLKKVGGTRVPKKSLVYDLKKIDDLRWDTPMTQESYSTWLWKYAIL